MPSLFIYLFIYSLLLLLLRSLLDLGTQLHAMPDLNLVCEHLVDESMLLDGREALEPTRRDLDGVHGPAPARYILYLLPPQNSKCQLTSWCSSGLIQPASQGGKGKVRQGRRERLEKWDAGCGKRKRKKESRRKAGRTCVGSNVLLERLDAAIEERRRVGRMCFESYML